MLFNCVFWLWDSSLHQFCRMAHTLELLNADNWYKHFKRLLLQRSSKLSICNLMISRTRALPQGYTYPSTCVVKHLDLQHRFSPRMHQAESAASRCNRCCLWLFVRSQYNFSWPICMNLLSVMSYIVALLTYLTDPSSLSISSVYLTPHASRCEKPEDPALSWCSVYELDIYIYVHIRMHKCVSGTACSRSN